MDSVVGARDAAARLLARELSDEDLAAELDRAGLEYAPDYEGMTHREWLELVVDRLTARLGSASEASDMETIGFIPMWRRIRQTGEVRPDPNGSSPRFECFTRSKRSVNRRDRRDRGLARPNAHLVRALRPRA